MNINVFRSFGIAIDTSVSLVLGSSKLPLRGIRELNASFEALNGSTSVQPFCISMPVRFQFEIRLDSWKLPREEPQQSGRTVLLDEPRARMSRVFIDIIISCIGSHATSIANILSFVMQIGRATLSANGCFVSFALGFGRCGRQKRFASEVMLTNAAQ